MAEKPAPSSNLLPMSTVDHRAFTDDLVAFIRAEVAIGDHPLEADTDLVCWLVEQHLLMSSVSQRQDISLPYLEQLFVKLRRAELVESVRGPGGGYRLAKPASEIRVFDVLAAVEETVSALHMGAGASGGLRWL